MFHSLFHTTASSEPAPLDLSRISVVQFWRARGAYGAVTAMEEMESWTNDQGEDVESALAELAQSLSSVSTQTLTEVITGSSFDVIALMGYLKTGRSLLLYRWLTEVNPSISAHLLDDAVTSGSDLGAILIERIRVLDRQQILAKIFSPDRIALVLEILEESGILSNDQ